MFSASVAFAVKTSLAASSPPKNSVRHILASYIFLDASSDASDAPRPELPQCFIASSTASYTDGYHRDGHGVGHGGHRLGGDRVRIQLGAGHKRRATAKVVRTVRLCRQGFGGVMR